MALQIWLPLNGTLENKGLSNVTVINHGATVDNDGKIGKCYYFNGINYLIGNGPLSNSTLNFSIAFWVKYDNLSDYHCIYSQRTGIGSGICVFKNNNHIRFDDGSNLWETPYTLTANIWTHVTVTRTSSEKKLYINGELKSTTTSGSLESVSSKFIIGMTSKNNDTNVPASNGLYGRLNDVRIYDHCLSPKEVKEISQGLVLHYTLDDYSRNTLLPPGVELYDYILSSGTLWIDTEVYGYMNHTYEIEFLQNDTGSYRLWGVFGLSSYIGYNMSLTYGTNVWLLRWNSTSSGLNNVTLASIDTDRHIFKVVNGHVYFDNVSKGTVVGHNSNLSINHNLFLFTINPAGATLTNNAKAKIYKYKDTDVNGNVVRNMLPCTYLGEPGMWDTVENKFYKNLGTGQFILGNKIATTYSNSIVYDCSGYLNNGLSVNTLTMSDSSSRYSHSIKFNSSAIKVTDNNWLSLGMEQLTINVWVKASSWPANTRIFSCTETGGFNMQSGDSGYYKFLVNVYTNSGKTSYTYKSETLEILISELPTNLWFMMTFVYNATEGTKSYINGLLNHTYTYQSYGIHFNTSVRLFLGCEPNTATPTTPYFNGLISDFRIYTTVLSDEDIKELYDTSAIVDNFGNSYCYQFEELMENVELNPPLNKFNKTNNPQNISFDGKDLVFTGFSSSYSNFIEIDSTKTYYYDITYSNQEGSWFLVGFERYDENKRTVSNNGCVYIFTSLSSLDKVRKTGTITFSNVNGNPCKFTKIRILNCWTPLSTITGGVGKIHSFHFMLADGTGNFEVTQQGQVKTGWFIEDELLLTLISKNKYMTTSELIEI